MCVCSGTAFARLAALARHRVSAPVWFDIAPTLGFTRYLPSLALAEVRAVRPDAVPPLVDLLTQPSVRMGELDATAARRVDQLLLDADVFDACAAHVVQVTRTSLARAHRRSRPIAPGGSRRPARLAVRGPCRRTAGPV